MSRDYQPGDVAMVTRADGVEQLAIAGRSQLDDTTVWVTASGARIYADTTHARRVVVIDPEGNIDAFADLIAERLSPDGGGVQAALRAALRERVNPKLKPIEPTGLGAVAEDTDGKQWVRLHDGTWQTGISSMVTITREWAKVDAVRVLSEGVTP